MNAATASPCDTHTTLASGKRCSIRPERPERERESERENERERERERERRKERRLREFIRS
jgi:hypothetical protein